MKKYLENMDVESEIARLVEGNLEFLSEALGEAGKVIEREKIVIVKNGYAVPSRLLIELLEKDRRGEARLSKISRVIMERMLRKRNRRLFGDRHPRRKKHYQSRRKTLRLRVRRFRKNLSNLGFESYAKLFWNDRLGRVVRRLLGKLACDESSKKERLESIKADYMRDISRAFEIYGKSLIAEGNKVLKTNVVREDNGKIYVNLLATLDDVNRDPTILGVYEISQ